MNITFSNQKIFSSQQVNDLYTSVGWTAYTNDLPKLLRAISKSSLVISAWHGEELVGLITVTRMYEANSKTITAQDDKLKSLLSVAMA